mmetsp:Transcript_76002/g.214208  ORF Transcript_76002/g.214208 Transcript_76002/m.214208 type:complete len:272 (-) Transcript_76002:712-1527(-)
MHSSDEARASSELVGVALLFALAFRCLDADLLVVLLECGQVLARLRELAFLHAFADIPVDECSLRVHQIELVIDARKNLCDRGGIADHAAGAHDLRQVSTWDNCRRLVVDAALEPGGAPIHELNGALRLDCRDRCVDILGHDITAVHHAARHVLAVARIALHEHAGGLEDAHGDLGHRQLLMVGLLSRDDRCVRGQHEVDARIRHEVRLEFGDVDVEGAIETQRRCQRRDNLSEEAVQVSVSRPLDVKVTPANVVQGLVVIHDGDIGVLEQ